MELLNNSLKACIVKLREKYFSSDLIIFNIIALMKCSEEVTYFEDLRRDQIVFAFPLTKTITKILYPEGGFTFKDLVKQANELVTESNLSSFNHILALMTKLNFSFDGKRLSAWYEKVNSSGGAKGRGRTTVTFNSGDKISVNLIKNAYICAHYSSADLSILDDFGVLKKDLSIINKSFVTLGKPLLIEGSNVYLRDTVLLAPAGFGSLKALGRLYSNEGDFTKKFVSPDDLTQMSQFLERDKEGFEQYAIQDALITLKHALSMESFNFSLKMLGVPVTLSSVGRNYVLEA